MATKTLSVRESAYEKLKKKKKENESFSDVIDRLASEKNLTEIAGLWKDNELRDKVEETRKETEKNLDETAERLK